MGVTAESRESPPPVDVLINMIEELGVGHDQEILDLFVRATYGKPPRDPILESALSEKAPKSRDQLVSFLEKLVQPHKEARV